MPAATHKRESKIREQGINGADEAGVHFTQGDVLFSDSFPLEPDEDVFRDDASTPSLVSDPIKDFYTSVKGIPLLTFREERGLDLTGLEQAPAGCNMEYQTWRIVHHTQRLVAELARTMPSEGVDTRDYIQAGILALIESADRWHKTTKRKRFGQFATAAIKRAMREIATHHTNFESTPAPRRRTRGRGQRRSWSEIPLPHRLTLNNQKRLCEFGDPYTTTVHRQALDAIRGVLTTLRPREAFLVELRVGFQTNRAMRWRAIGREMGVSRERIFEIAHRAARKLTHPSRKRILQKHFEAILSCPTVEQQESPIHKFLLSIQDGKLMERWDVAKEIA